MIATIAGAIFFTTLATIPMLVALARGERVRYLEHLRELEAVAREP